MSQTPKRILDGGGDANEQRARALLESHDSTPPPGARHRVWQEITEPAPRASTRLVWLVPVAALVLLAAIFYPRTERTGAPPAPKLAEAGKAAPVVKPELAVGSSVSTPARTTRVVAIPGHGKVQLSENTRIVFTQLEPQLELRLETGRIELLPLENAPFSVVAGTFGIRAVGRSIAIERQADSVIVEPKDGAAELRGPVVRKLSSGERFDSRELAHAALPDPAPQEAPRRSTTPTALSAPSQREVYEQAKSAHGSAAIALFDRAAASDGPLTELASYQAARLELTLGHFGEALRRFEGLRARFPNGTLARETGLSSIECLLELSRLGDAERALDAYLHRYPDTERQSELRYLRAELQRKTGDCDRALTTYAEIREGPRAADALYMSAWCAAKLGRQTLAASGLRDYLGRFPQGRHAAAATRYLKLGHFSDEKP